MLFGTANVADLATRAPRMAQLTAEPLELPQIELLQVAYEIRRSGIEEMFPPALQPTLPPLATWALYRCADGPLGPFQLAQLRLSCRSGARPRTLLVGCFTDSEQAGRALTEGWGYGPRAAAIRLREAYDRIDATVEFEGRAIAQLSMLDRVPLRLGDIQFAAGVHPAHTPRGFRLVQVDPKFRVTRSERGAALLTAFDAASWGDGRVQPTRPVTATFSTADLILGPLRFVSRPDVNAFEGMEAL